MSLPVYTAYVASGLHCLCRFRFTLLMSLPVYTAYVASGLHCLCRFRFTLLMFILVLMLMSQCKPGLTNVIKPHKNRALTRFRHDTSPNELQWSNNWITNHTKYDPIIKRAGLPYLCLELIEIQLEPWLVTSFIINKSGPV